MLNQVLWAAISAVLGIVIGYVVRESIASKKATSVENKLKNQVAKAEKEANELVIEAQKKAVAIIEDAKSESRERKTTMDRLESRLISKEEELSEKEKLTRKKEEEIKSAEETIKSREEEVSRVREEATEQLSKVAGLSKEEAFENLMKEVEEKHKDELSSALFKLAHERKEEIEKKSQEIMTTAVQRYARSHISDITTSVFTLPSDDLKGKIIGREGRNIKTLERLAGVEFIVDESPETIIISSFDPFRREIARLALEKLIKDGRIQPAKIEEKVNEAQVELDKRIFEIGEEAAQELGIFNFPKEILQLLGRLHFRTSFGQNVLTHSIEMAYISGMMASELGADVEVAKRGALLHDIGKAIDHDVEGTHVELGRKILRKYGIADEVIHAMQSHHEEYPFATPESFIVTAADALSAARPGARRGTVENYIKRLGDLEEIAKSFDGVKNAYAIAAGRELRVFVTPEKIDDFRALQLARDIASKIEADMKYPGEIKVNVIREMRAVEYAK